VTFFTSRRSISAWVAAGKPALGEVAALKPATSNALEAEGITPTIISEGGVVSLAEAVLAWAKGPLTIHYPTSDLGLKSPEQAHALELLQKAGTVERRMVYEIAAPANLRQSLERSARGDWAISFASPSAVQHFFSSGAVLEQAPVRVACLGASTERAWNSARPAGWPQAVNTREAPHHPEVSVMTLSIPVRLRRLRSTPNVRAMFSETQVTLRQLVQPYFVVPGKGIKQETRPGYGLWQVSPDVLREEIGLLNKAGVGGVMLFGVPEHKRDDGKGLDVQMEPLRQAIVECKSAAPELPLFADVCLCAYTTHGHCGLVKGNTILNDESVVALTDMAIMLAKWGVDFVSPSDMMDGRIGAMRKGLDEAGLQHTSILSYAIKMASAFYGPFREAAHSAPGFGDRKSYQMPAGNRREARRELLLDVAEGADAVMVKPAMTNLDLIRDSREATDLPIFAYQVSGEYAMLRASGDAGLMDFDRALEESLVAIRRAGADVIVSYAARPWAMR